MIQMNLCTNQKGIHRQRKQTQLPKGKGGEENKLRGCDE